MKAIDYKKELDRLKRLIVLSSLSLLLVGIFTTTVSAQNKVCLNDTVKVYIDEYRGTANWQKSLNGADWTEVTDAEGDTISLLAIEAFWIRLEVLEGTCLPFYSEVLAIELHDPPVVEFQSRDSACINERDFLLSGGTPEGGNYFGPGVQNNRFYPDDAGIGVHELAYYFKDPETTCSDTSYSQIEVFSLTSNAEAGADLELITSDSVQLQANTADFGIGTWSVVSGVGGEFTDINNANTWFIKDSAQTEYVLRWTIEGPCGTNSDDVNLSFMQLSINPCPGAPVVIDVDGNVYKTIQIDKQCWMAENLRTGVFVPSIANGLEHSDLSDNGVIEKYCFENDTANCLLYGGLYDWHEAVGYTDEEEVQGVCPDGWHIPTNQDWADLDAQFKYGDAGKHLKETGDAGFGGQLAGDRHNKGAFYSFDSSGFWWSSTTYSYMDINEGYFRKICACNGALEKNHFNKYIGLSVRCVKDK